MTVVRRELGEGTGRRSVSLPRRSSFWRRVALMIVIGLILRVLYVVLSWNFVPQVDTAGYVQRGLFIWEHHGALMPVLSQRHKWVDDTWWPPVYPYFLALLIGCHQLIHLVGLIGPIPQSGVPGPIRGSGIEALFRFLRVLLTIFGVLTVPLVAIVGRRMMGERVGLAAAALMAVYPPLIYVGASLYPEALFVILLLLAIICVIRYAESANLWWLVAAGIVTGLTTLTHSNAFWMLIPLTLGAWLAARERFSRIWRVLWAPALMCVMTALTLAPWTIRNAVELHAFIPISSSFGPTLAGTYNSAAAKFSPRPYVWELPKFAYPKVHEQTRHMSTLQAADAAYEQAALNYIGRHPYAVAQVGFWNSLRLFELTGPEGMGGSEYTATFEGIPRGPTWVGDFTVWIVGLLAIGSCFTRTVRRGRYRWVWLMPLVMYLSVVFITVETPRFRAGIDPFLVLGAAAALVSLGSRNPVVTASGSDSA